MTETKVDHLVELMRAREAATLRILDWKQALGETERRLRKHALERFMTALAERGIAPEGNIIIDGMYSGSNAARIRDIKHDDTPVFFRSASVDSIKATDPRPNSTEVWWWFRVKIARLKKNGQPRDEWRHLVVNGDTPEDAAAKIAKPKEASD